MRAIHKRHRGAHVPTPRARACAARFLSNQDLEQLQDSQRGKLEADVATGPYHHYLWCRSCLCCCVDEDGGCTSSVPTGPGCGAARELAAASRLTLTPETLEMTRAEPGVRGCCGAARTQTLTIYHLREL